MNALEVARFVTRHGLQIILPSEFTDDNNEYLGRVFREYYKGPHASVEFVVFWRKAIDSEEADRWNGEPLRGDLLMTRVDDPDNWKCTLFVFHKGV